MCILLVLLILGFFYLSFLPSSGLFSLLIFFFTTQWNLSTLFIVLLILPEIAACLPTRVSKVLYSYCFLGNIRTLEHIRSIKSESKRNLNISRYAPVGRLCMWYWHPMGWFLFNSLIGSRRYLLWDCWHIRLWRIYIRKRPGIRIRRSVFSFWLY